MRPKQSHLPISREEVHNYHHQITRTDEFLAARNDIRLGARDELESAPNNEARSRIMRALTRETIARAAGDLIGNIGAYEGLKFDPAYNNMLRTLPELNEGIHGLREHTGGIRANKEKIIHFNHAVKNLINLHPATSPDELTELLQNTFFINGYGSDLLEVVQHNIIPGMNHELAFESNLFYLPREPEILETSVDDELMGTDYKLRYDDGIVIRIDVKKNSNKAARLSLERAAQRKERGYRSPDSQLIIASGYQDSDFIPDKIGRVTESARQREQTRINDAIDATYMRIAAHRQRIDNMSKM